MSKIYKWILLSKYCMLLCFLCIQQQSKAQTADLIIQKTGPTSVKEGLPMTYTIKVSNNGPTAVTNATFSDTFPANVSAVNLRICTEFGGAICPNTSQYTISKFYVFPDSFTVFKGTIPFLPVNSYITFTIDLNAPPFRNASSISNTATVKVPIGITDPDLTTNTSTWNTVLIDTVPVIINQKYDIAVIKTVNDTNGYDCLQYPKNYKYTVKWVNKGPRDVEGITLVDNLIAIVTNIDGIISYPWKISDTIWSFNPSTYPLAFFSDTGRFDLTPSNNYTYISGQKRFVPLFKRGDTITYSYTFTIYKPISDCGANVKWNLNNEAHFYKGFFDIPPNDDTVPNNNSQQVTSKVMTCSAPKTDFTNVNTHVKITKTVDDTTTYNNDSLPRTYNYTVKWINDGSNNVTNMSITDKMATSLISSSGFGNATYEYPWSISNVVWKISQGSSVTNITPFLLSGTCYPGSSITTYIGNVPLLEVGDTISLTYTFTLGKPIITGVGRNIQWELANSAEYYYPGCTPGKGNAGVASENIGYSPEIKKTDLKVTNNVDDIQSYVCQKETKTLHYKVQWVNGGPTDANNVSISNGLYPPQFYTTISYKWEISDVLWSSSSGATLPIDTFTSKSGLILGPSYCSFFFCTPLTSIQSNIPSFKVGDTINLSYTFTIQPPTQIGCGGNIDWQLQNRANIFLPFNFILIDTLIDNNNSIIANSFKETSTDLVISTSVNPAIVDDGDILTITNEFYNAAGAYAKPAIWLDTLPETFHIDLSSITCSLINGNSGCGRITYDSTTRILRQEIDSMPANSGVKVTFKGTVNSLYTVTEYNKVFAYNACLDCVPATNFTQSNYQINGECDSVFAGVDGDTAVYDNYTDTIFLFKLLKGKPQLGGTWFQLSGTGGIFNAAAGTFIVKPRTTTSTFMYVLPANAPCPADTSIVTITILEQPTPDTIIKTIPINTTTTICDFLPNNISDVTVAVCNNSTSLNWNINSQTKCVEYNSSNIKGNDTICVSVCNTQTQVCKETNIIITINGVPPHANDDTLIETSINTPVTISVLTNDITPDNDSLALCNPPLFTQPIHGNVEINQNGTITYIPALGYIGKDSFQYIICDAEGNDTAWVRIAIKCDVNDTCCDIPNAFSPNGDGINDIFRIRCSCVLEEFYLIIYNRWGNKVFESRDVNIGWDGKYKNKIDQVEAYGYYLEYRSVCGTKKVTKKGNVTLIE